MIGAIAGDMLGSLYERYPIKNKDFDLLVSGFTDDTVLTVAVADAILSGGDFAEFIKRYAQLTHMPGTAEPSGNGCGAGKTSLTTVSATVRLCGSLLWDSPSTPQATF